MPGTRRRGRVSAPAPGSAGSLRWLQAIPGHGSATFTERRCQHLAPEQPCTNSPPPPAAEPSRPSPSGAARAGKGAPGAGQGESHSIKTLSPRAPTGSKHHAHTCGCSPGSFRPRCLISARWGRGWRFEGTAEVRSLGTGTGTCCWQSPCSLLTCLGTAGSSGLPDPGRCRGHPKFKFLPPKSTPGPWQLPVNGTGMEPLLGFTH